MKGGDEMDLFSIHVYHHFEGDSVSKKLDTILALLKDVQRKEVILMKEVDDLIVEVAATQGEEESIEVAIDQILAYIKQILDQIANTVDPAVIKGLTDKLAAYRAALAAKKADLLAAIPANPTP
jgi:type I site-specific restriction-modification system R (restriction) subunit